MCSGLVFGIAEAKLRLSEGISAQVIKAQFTRKDIPTKGCKNCQVLKWEKISSAEFNQLICVIVLMKSYLQ